MDPVMHQPQIATIMAELDAFELPTELRTLNHTREAQKLARFSRGVMEEALNDLKTQKQLIRARQNLGRISPQGTYISVGDPNHIEDTNKALLVSSRFEKLYHIAYIHEEAQQYLDPRTLFSNKVIIESFVEEWPLCLGSHNNQTIHSDRAPLFHENHPHPVKPPDQKRIEKLLDSDIVMVSRFLALGKLHGGGAGRIYQVEFHYQIRRTDDPDRHIGHIYPKHEKYAAVNYLPEDRPKTDKNAIRTTVLAAIAEDGPTNRIEAGIMGKFPKLRVHVPDDNDRGSNYSVITTEYAIQFKDRKDPRLPGFIIMKSQTPLHLKFCTMVDNSTTHRVIGHEQSHPFLVQTNNAKQFNQQYLKVAWKILEDFSDSNKISYNLLSRWLVGLPAALNSKWCRKLDKLEMQHIERMLREKFLCDTVGYNKTNGLLCDWKRLNHTASTKEREKIKESQARCKQKAQDCCPEALLGSIDYKNQRYWIKSMLDATANVDFAKLVDAEGIQQELLETKCHVIGSYDHLKDRKTPQSTINVLEIMPGGFSIIEWLINVSEAIDNSTGKLGRDRTHPTVQYFPVTDLFNERYLTLRSNEHCRQDMREYSIRNRGHRALMLSFDGKTNNHLYISYSALGNEYPSCSGSISIETIGGHRKMELDPNGRIQAVEGLRAFFLLGYPACFHYIIKAEHKLSSKNIYSTGDRPKEQGVMKDRPKFWMESGDIDPAHGPIAYQKHDNMPEAPPPMTEIDVTTELRDLQLADDTTGEAGNPRRNVRKASEIESRVGERRFIVEVDQGSEMEASSSQRPRNEVLPQFRAPQPLQHFAQVSTPENQTTLHSAPIQMTQNMPLPNVEQAFLQTSPPLPQTSQNFQGQFICQNATQQRIPQVTTIQPVTAPRTGVDSFQRIPQLTRCHVDEHYGNPNQQQMTNQPMPLQQPNQQLCHQRFFMSNPQHQQMPTLQHQQQMPMDFTQSQGQNMTGIQVPMSVMVGRPQYVNYEQMPMHPNHQPVQTPIQMQNYPMQNANQQHQYPEMVYQNCQAPPHEEGTILMDIDEWFANLPTSSSDLPGADLSYTQKF